MRSSQSHSSVRRSISALAIAAYLIAALLAVPAQANGVGSPDTECGVAGFDFGIERWGFAGNWSLTDSGTKAADYLIVVSGTDHLATWTSSSAVSGVLAKSGSPQSGGGTVTLPGGTSGTITVANLPGLGGHGLSHVTFCGNFPPPAASASSTACDNDGALGPNTGTILVGISNIDADDVTITIGGAPGAVGSNPVQAGTHTVLVTNDLANNATILSQQVTVADCTPVPPAATASSTACDNDGVAGPNTGTILVGVSNIDADDVTVTIGGASGIVGSNPVQAGTYTVLVTNDLANNATILSQQVTVTDCTPAPTPAATASSTACDNDGALAPNTGTILVGVSNIDADDVTVTIGGAPGIVGSNPVQAGTYTVLVTNDLANNATILSQQVTVADCTPAPGPTSAAVSLGLGNCVFGAQSTTPVSTTISPAGGASIALTKVGTGLINTFTGSGGSMSLTPGSYTWLATAQPGFQLTGITSGSFSTVPCDVLGTVTQNVTTAAQSPPAQVLGQQITRGQPLPATGPAIPMMQMLSLALAAILLGFSLNSAGTRRTLQKYAPKHQARDREWVWKLDLPQNA